MRTVLFSILVVALLIGCSAPREMPATPGAEGALKCEQAIDYNILVTALPNNVAGFAPAADPEGSTMTWQDPGQEQTITYSSAQVNLVKGEESDNPQYIDVSIMDTCYVQFLSTAWWGYAQFESTSGYLRKTEMNGQPAWKSYDKGTESYGYIIFVNERVIVSVSGTEGVSDADVQAAAEAIDYDSIADAAQ